MSTPKLFMAQGSLPLDPVEHQDLKQRPDYLRGRLAAFVDAALVLNSILVPSVVQIFHACLARWSIAIPSL